MEQEWGSPYLHIHRADFHRLLFDLARPGINDLRLKSTVVSVNPGSVSPDVRPSATLASGEVIEADLVVGADGVKSIVQRTVLGLSPKEHAEKNPAIPTGDAAYRVLVPTALMLASEDPEMRRLVEEPEMTAWMGPRRHVLGYCVVSLPSYPFRFLSSRFLCSCRHSDYLFSS